METVWAWLICLKHDKFFEYTLLLLFKSSCFDMRLAVSRPYFRNLIDFTQVTVDDILKYDWWLQKLFIIVITLLKHLIFYVYRYIYVFNFVLFTFIWKVVFLQHLFTKCIVSSIEIDSGGCSWSKFSSCLKFEKSKLDLEKVSSDHIGKLSHFTGARSYQHFEKCHLWVEDSLKNGLSIEQPHNTSYQQPYIYFQTSVTKIGYFKLF